MKYFIETYGCQMNVHDSERMAGLLEQAGYEATADAARRRRGRHQHVQRSRARRRQALHASRRSAPGERVRPAATPVVAVAGCVAQQEAGALLKRSNLIDVIIGTQSLKQLPALVGQALADADAAPRIDVNIYEDVSFPLGVARRHDPVKAYVTIIEGCNEFCSFCVVPYTRGARADAPEARHPRRSAPGGRRGAPRDSAARTDREPLPGAR